MNINILKEMIEYDEKIIYDIENKGEKMYNLDYYKGRLFSLKTVLKMVTQDENPPAVETVATADSPDRISC